jgi:hypothetical protein
MIGIESIISSGSECSLYGGCSRISRVFLCKIRYGIAGDAERLPVITKLCGNMVMSGVTGDGGGDGGYGDGDGEYEYGDGGGDGEYEYGDGGVGDGGFGT